MAQFILDVSPLVPLEFQSGAFPIEQCIISGDFQGGKVRPMHRAATLDHSFECNRVSPAQPFAFGEQVDTCRAIHDSRLNNTPCGCCPILLISDAFKC